MWILESEGEFLQVVHAIDHKTVSRKHFVIEVGAVKKGSGSQLHRRSKLTITDEKTKGGTYIDGGTLLHGNSMELRGIKHTIRPGKYPHVLKVEWHQVCLSFSFSSKEMQGDPLASRRERLEELDIKTVVEYVVGETTHVVTTKRNTAKGLQALINGKYIVNNSYIDALVYAATSEDLAEPENVCPMEKDFDAAWPDPTKHLPPSGKEIIDMPAASSEACFGPNPERQNMFKDFTFVFCSKDQYENLLPMVTNGHGKGLLFPMENGKTTADELEQYMRNAGGHKGIGNVETRQQKGGIVLVRWLAKGSMQKWADALADEVSLRIDQRPIEQGDFLNIILNNKPHSLRRSCGIASTAGESIKALPTSSSRTVKPPQSSPIRPEPTKGPSPTQTIGTRRPHSQDEDLQPAPKRPRTRGPIKSRFKTFDDGFDIDIDSIPTYQNGPPDSFQRESEAPSERAEQQAISQFNSDGQSQEGHVSESDDDERIMDDLLPAAAAMKRQRLEMQQNAKSGKKASQVEDTQPVKKIKKVGKETDVLEAARKRREAEEEAIRRDQEALANADIDVENIRDLAVVEEMELPVRTDKPSRVSGQASDRWNEKWNGRKNFKRFRRCGDSETRLRHIQNVIVPLEEAKNASYGIGSDYWPSSTSRSSKKDTQRSSASQSRPRPSTAETQPATDSANSETTRLQQEAEKIVGAIDVDEPRHTRAEDQTTSFRSQTQASKRPAAEQTVGKAAKRQRTLRTRADDDSDDELKFRFGRKK